ncbi:hypothetical protein SALBM311S_03257 [Streptomyces alboniger]
MTLPYQVEKVSTTFWYGWPSWKPPECTVPVVRSRTCHTMNRPRMVPPQRMVRVA